MDYGLTVGGRDVGKVQLLKEGLYYRIFCRAELYGAVMYRLVAVTEGRRENVGILAPVSGGYGLERKLPCSRLSLEGLSFLLLPSHEPVEGKFVPISPEEPFSYLQKLQDLDLAKRSGEVGVVIPE